MYNYIISSSYLLGSFYLFSISLTLTNEALLDNKKIIASIATGRQPFGLAISPDQKTVLVANVGMYAYPIVEGTTKENIQSQYINWHPYGNNTKESIEGKSYVSRVGVSLLSNLGLEKYIAKTIDEYIDIVVKLASNTSELRLLHQTLRLRMMNSDLANSTSFTINIENGYEDMIKEYNNLN